MLARDKQFAVQPCPPPTAQENDSPIRNKRARQCAVQELWKNAKDRHGQLVEKATYDMASLTVRNLQGSTQPINPQDRIAAAQIGRH